jgi:hypothetical protein
MTRPWIRLDADFAGDSKLLRAGSDARLIWPHVLALLKRCHGVATDDDLHPEAMAAVCGTVEQWTAGLDGLRRVGLLTFGPRECRQRRAVWTKEGWQTPNWDRFQPDSRPRAKDRTLPQGQSGTKRDRVGQSGTRAVPSSLSDCPVQKEQPPVVPQKSQKASKSTPTKRQRDAVALDDLWQDLSGAKLRPGTAAEKKRLARWGRYLKDHTFEDLAAMVRALSKDEWWRGGNRDGKDLFREGPAKFLNDAEKVEARVKAASGEVGAKAWLTTWRGAVDMFTAEVRGRRMAGGRESFVAFAGKYNAKALPVPADVLDIIDRRTGAA